MATLPYTILGSRGYIGSHLTRHLQSTEGVSVMTDQAPLPEHLGHVLFCIGVTTDFRSRLHDTMRAHVQTVMEVLEKHRFDSLTYLSSIRVYEGGSDGHESAALTSKPAELYDYYKISKIAGEAVCLSHPAENVRVVRLSNVLGLETPPMTFVPALIRDALQTGCIKLQTALRSAKDYITMSDVLEMLPKIAATGTQRLYNLASGVNTTHGEILSHLSAALEFTVEKSGESKPVDFPPISIQRIQQEFGYAPSCLGDFVRQLCVNYKNLISKNNP